MSIDARIAGVQVKADGEVRLVLEPREKGGHAGQSVMTILNPPRDTTLLNVLIGECVWGNASVLMIGDTKFADRIGYTKLRLLDPREKARSQSELDERTRNL